MQLVLLRHAKSLRHTRIGIDEGEDDKGYDEDV